MYIKRICYPITVLGPGKRIGIWVTGCNKTCKDCMSPELKIRNPEDHVPLKKIIEMIVRIPQKIDGFTISGGEPFLQIKELRKLVTILNRTFSDDIIIYTGYTLKELRDMKDEDVEYILCNISVLIDGEYIAELNDGIGLRGSSNQIVHVFRKANHGIQFDTQKRQIQEFMYGDKILLIGIQ